MSQSFYELRIDLTDFDGNSTYAHYDNFDIGDFMDNYTLRVNGYTGTAGINDQMATHKKQHSPLTKKKKKSMHISQTIVLGFYNLSQHFSAGPEVIKIMLKSTIAEMAQISFPY